jgi:hypothetical protein
MSPFLSEYVACLCALPRNPWFWAVLALIVMGGHPPLGKVLAAIALTFIVPLFQMQQKE